MKFRINIRELNIQDLGPNCPFAPNPDELEMYMTAALEDIYQVEGITRASLDRNKAFIVDADTDLAGLLENLQPIFSRNFNYFKFHSIQSLTSRTEGL